MKSFHYLKKYLTDGRLIIAVALIIYGTTYFVAIYKYNFNIMILQRVPVVPVSFLDLRSLTAAYDSMDLGLDPLVNNVLDPFRRPINYPRIWTAFSIFGITQAHTNIIGMTLAVVFYACFTFLVVPQITKKTAAVYIIAILSSAATFAVERGNNDLIIFIILALALWGFRKEKTLTNTISYLLILLAAILKLYPIYAFTVFLKEKKKSYLTDFSILFFIFLCYCMLTYNDLIIISKTVPQVVHWSYGRTVLFDYVANLIKVLTNRDIRLVGVLTKVASVIFSLAIIIFALIYSNRKKQNEKYSNHTYMNGFRIGSSIFLGTFLMGNNWNYRLVFLLFCLPQLIEWSSLKLKISLAHVITTLILVSLWSALWMDLENPLVVFIKEAIDWIIVFGLTSLLLLTSPEWLTRMLRLEKLPLIKTSTEV